MGSAVWVSLIEGAAFSVLLLVFAEYMPGIFGINEPEVLGHCVNAVRIISTTLIISSVLYLFETYYMTQGKNIIALASSFARNLVFILICAVPLGLALGINGVWTAFALAQPLTLTLCVWLSFVMYGRKNFPMYLEDGGNIADFDLLLTPENVMTTRDKAEQFMASKNVSDSTANRIMLMIEETGMMIIERNKGRKVLAEYTIELYGEVQEEHNDNQLQQERIHHKVGTRDAGAGIYCPAPAFSLTSKPSRQRPLRRRPSSASDHKPSRRASQISSCSPHRRACCCSPAIPRTLS